MSLKFRIVIFVLLTLWLFGIFYEWFIPVDHYLNITYPIIKRTYSLVCHQDSHKLIEFNNRKTLVCSRCTGIYIGTFLISLVFLFKVHFTLPSLKIFISVILITLFDVLSTTFGLYHYTKIIAFTTGLFLGSIAFLYFYFGMKQFIDELNKDRI